MRELVKFEERGSVTKWSEFGPPTESTHKVTREDIVFHVGIRSRHWAHLWWTLWMLFGIHNHQYFWFASSWSSMDVWSYRMGQDIVWKTWFFGQDFSISQIIVSQIFSLPKRHLSLFCSHPIFTTPASVYTSTKKIRDFERIPRHVKVCSYVNCAF